MSKSPRDFVFSQHRSVVSSASEISPKTGSFSASTDDRWCLPCQLQIRLPSRKHTKNYGKPPFSMGKSTN